MTDARLTSSLDRHKETHQLSFADTTAALRATGDYEDDGSAGVGAEIPQKARDLGKIKASAWWSQVYSEIERRRGSAAAADLRKRMNETR
jgi:hypothetical protein